MASRRDAMVSGWEATLANDPQYQSIIQEGQQLKAAGGKSSLFNRDNPLRQNTAAQNARMRELGIDLPDDYHVKGSSGDIERDNWFERNNVKLGLGAMAGIAGGAFLPALLGGGAASGGGGAAAYAPGASNALTAGSMAAPAAAGGGSAMAGGAMRFMNSPFGLSLLGFGTDILGGLISGEDEERSKNLLAGLPNSDPRKAVVDPVNQMYNAIRQANTLAQAFGQRAASPVRPRGPAMPGFGGRGEAQVPLGGGGQGPQGLDVSALLAELQGALPERRPLPGAGSTGPRLRTPFTKG